MGRPAQMPAQSRAEVNDEIARLLQQKHTVGGREYPSGVLTPGTPSQPLAVPPTQSYGSRPQLGVPALRAAPSRRHGTARDRGGVGHAHSPRQVKPSTDTYKAAELVIDETNLDEKTVIPPHFQPRIGVGDRAGPPVPRIPYLATSPADLRDPLASIKNHTVAAYPAKNAILVCVFQTVTKLT